MSGSSVLADSFEAPLNEELPLAATEPVDQPMALDDLTAMVKECLKNDWFELGERLALRALTQTEIEFGVQHVKTAFAYFRLAKIKAHDTRVKFKEALGLALHAAEMFELTRDKDDDEGLWDCWGWIIQAANLLGEAETAYQAFKKFKQLFKSKPKDRLAMVLKLCFAVGRVCVDNALLNRAEEQYLDYIDIWKERQVDESYYGNSPPIRLAQVMTHLARVQFERGRSVKAWATILNALNEAETDRWMTQGQEDLNIVWSQYGVMHQHAGTFDKAFDAYEQALMVVERAFSRSSDKYVVAHLNMAALLVELGRYDEAQTHVDLAYQVGLDLWGLAHPLMFDVNMVWSRIELVNGRYKEALNHIAGIDFLRRFIGMKEDADLALWLDLEGEIYLAMDQPTEARTYLEKALSICDANKAYDSEPAGMVLSHLAQLEQVHGDLKEARHWAQQALYIAERRQFADHPERAYRMDLLAMILYQLGQKHQALELLEKAAAILSKAKTHHPEHPRFVLIRQHLASVLADSRSVDLPL